jgi:hypothetical protein
MWVGRFSRLWEDGHEFGAGPVAGGSFGGAVRDQAGDRAVCLGVVHAASCPALPGAPPVAAAPLAAPGLASRLPPRREFGDKLAKVSP